MVESLKELNTICQKPDYTTKGNWMARHIVRPAALPITWLLLHTPVSANQVTLVSLGVGLAGIYLLALVPKALFLAGVLLFQMWYLLDHVDGQIARYRENVTLTGRFLDFLTHHVIHGTVFFSLAIYCVQSSGSLFFVLWGFLVSISMMTFNLIHDVKAKTFYERIAAEKGMRLRNGTSGEGKASEKDETNPWKSLFALLHKSMEIHVLMNILTLASLVQLVSQVPLDLRMLLFFYYGTAVPAVTVIKIVYLVESGGIDREFEEHFTTQEPPNGSGASVSAPADGPIPRTDGRSGRGPSTPKRAKHS
ncbi:MAG: CDP-alcohol phosphatidyltransferase family protein [Candidatus Omnitrophica bacterium]|nr:CDP-alcohol phosphatidyltransferase family protein [Candidatus Omnitrophota bacterium]